MVDLSMIEQFCRDLNDAHNEILKLQGVPPEDYDRYDWPEWSGPANSIRWAERLLKKPLSKTSQRKDLKQFEREVIAAFAPEDFAAALPCEHDYLSGCPHCAPADPASLEDQPR